MNQSMQNGYENIADGSFISDEEIFNYALEKIRADEKEEFLDWFYSGNWVRREHGVKSK